MRKRRGAMIEAVESGSGSLSTPGRSRHSSAETLPRVRGWLHWMGRGAQPIWKYSASPELFE